MLKLNPEFLIKNNKKQFAILPYEQFIKIKECLEDLKDLKELRLARKKEKSKKGYTLQQVKTALKIK